MEGNGRFLYRSTFVINGVVWLMSDNKTESYTLRMSENLRAEMKGYPYINFSAFIRALIQDILEGIQHRQGYGNPVIPIQYYEKVAGSYSESITFSRDEVLER